MMQPEDLYDIVHRKPFQPLRVHLTDGRFYDILYPYNNVVGTTFLVIGIPEPNDPMVAERTIKVSLDLIDRVEDLKGASPSVPR